MEWTKENIKYLKENVGKISVSDMAAESGRTKGSIKAKIRRLNLKVEKNKVEESKVEKKAKSNFSEEDNKYIRENIKPRSYTEIAKYLGVSYNQLKWQIHLLGLHKKKMKEKKKNGFHLKEGE